MRIGSYVGCYRLVRLLAQGGMGAVYEGLNETLDRRVAVKLMHESLAHDREQCVRFFNEAYVVNLIHHSSLVAIHEHGQLDDGTYYIVMEYLEGQTLAQRLRARGGEPLPLSQLVRLTRQVAAGLAAAHDKQVVHRDLKPENLMLVADPEVAGGERVKILDFGIAKVRGPEGVSVPAGATRQGSWLGTPGYIAPEQVYGASSVDGRADVYSLGVILYELLSGSRPFRSDDSEQELRHHLTAVPPPLHLRAPSTPAGLAGLVHAMLAKQPEERPTMAVVVEQLHAMETSTHSSSLLVGQTAPRPLAARSLAGAGVAVFLLVVLLQVGGFYWINSPGPQPGARPGDTAPGDGGTSDFASPAEPAERVNRQPPVPSEVADMAVHMRPDLGKRQTKRQPKNPLDPNELPKL